MAENKVAGGLGFEPRLTESESPRPRPISKASLQNSADAAQDGPMGYGANAKPAFTVRTPKYVHAFRDRHGVARYYFRRGGFLVRLPSPDDPGFATAYANAASRLEPEYSAEVARRTFAAACRTLSSRAKQRSKERGWPCSITTEWVSATLAAQQYRCAMTGIAFRGEKGAHWIKNPYSPSLDRLDNAKGYEPSNVRIILAAVNFALNEWGEDVFRHIAAGLIRSPSPRTVGRGE